jgi:hypothetical protein
MTLENQPKQPSKRFSKLDAIPRHKRSGTLKESAARLYIGRRFTGPAAALSLTGVVIGAVLFSPTPELEDYPITVSEVRSQAEDAPLKENVPLALPSEPEIKPAADVPASVEVASVNQPDVPTVAVVEDEPVVPENESASASADEPAPSVRQIIPVAEGLELYGPPIKDKAEHELVDDAPPRDPTPTTFSLPTAGVPTEDEMAGFLAVPPVQPVPTSIEVIPPEEDMSPTIVLPDLVPSPVARPEPELAQGTRIEFRIVQGPGVKSGFWLGNKQDPNSRRFFVVVAPYLANGERTKWKFTNIADGSPANTDRMAVEVSEDAFVALAKESKEFGQIKDAVLGRGEVGGKAVKWRIDSVGGNLIAGWDRETGN